MKKVLLLTGAPLLMMAGVLFVASCSSDVENMETRRHIQALFGTWQLVSAKYGESGTQDYQAGDLTITFNDNMTLTVENNKCILFFKEGSYPYITTIEQSRILTYQWADVEYSVLVVKVSDEREDRYIYSLHDDTLFLDGGVVSDGPGFVFKRRTPDSI